MVKTCAQKLVWVDTDITIGHKAEIIGYCDVDDGYALAALLRSVEVDVVAVSSTLGNTDDINVSTQIARNFISSFGPNSVPVYQGAAAQLPDDLQKVETNEAVEAMVEVLSQNRMTLLAIGAATNIAILLIKYPELAHQIDEIVAVAGRRSLGQHFISGRWQPKPFRDLNFETDVQAYSVLLKSDVPVTLVPYEVCCTVWIQPHDLFRLEKGSKVGKYLAHHSLGWLTEWEIVFGANGFNPFDMVAAAYIIDPHLFSCKTWDAILEYGPDDTDSKKEKSYLICNEAVTGGEKVNYCVGVNESCKENLLNRICTHDMAMYLLGLSHINVIVDGIEEATRFYSETLGFEQAYDTDGKIMDYQRIEMRSFALDAGIMDGNAVVDVRFLKHPQAEIHLEMMVYHEPEGCSHIPAQPKTYDLGGPRHIAMEVSNCNEVFAFLNGREGVTMINTGKDYHPAKLDGFPITFFYWVDKYGIQWEMEEGRRMGVSRGIL